MSKADLQEQADVNPEHFRQRYSQSSAYPPAAPVRRHQQGDMLRISC